jgi:sugar lactone lactonase YvrE
MRTTEAAVWQQPAAEEDRFLPEGPRLLAGDDAWSWVNIQRSASALTGDLFVWNRLTKQLKKYPLPGRPGFALPTKHPDRLIVGCDQTIGLYDLCRKSFKLLANIPQTTPHTMINDAQVVPGGDGIVFGTKDPAFRTPAGQLYHFSVMDNSIKVLATGMTCSNGKVFSPDGKALYDIDTPRKCVTMYRFDSAKSTLKDDGIALDLGTRDDFPDGMIDGGDGTVIIAFYNPQDVPMGRAVRFDMKTGQPKEEWLTPKSPRVTCPMLFEEAGRIRLILTTADEGMPSDLRLKSQNAGCLFVAETTMTTLPAGERFVNL